MNKIILFPQKNTKKVIEYQKLEAQRMGIGLVIVSFVFITILVNEQMLKHQKPIYVISDNEIQNSHWSRQVAQTNEQEHSIKDIEWEHKLATQLSSYSPHGEIRERKNLKDGDLQEGFDSSNNRVPASDVGEQISHLRYGYLEGKYLLKSSSNQHLERIQFVDSADDSSKPIVIEKRSEFLNRYKNLFSLSFKEVKLKVPQQSTREISSARIDAIITESYELLNQEQKVVGKAVFELDGEDRFISLSFIP